MKIDELKYYAHIEFEYNEKLEQENQQLRAENEKLLKVLKGTICCSDFRIYDCEDCPYTHHEKVSGKCLFDFNKDLGEVLKIET